MAFEGDLGRTGRMASVDPTDARMTPEHVGMTKSVGHLLRFLGDREVPDPHGSRPITDDELDCVLGGEALRLYLVLMVLLLFGQGHLPQQSNVMPVGPIDEYGKIHPARGVGPARKRTELVASSCGS